MPNHKPTRICIVCRKKGDKSEFFKIVKNRAGQVLVETDKKLEGRGAYICKNSDCVKKCEKSKALNRTFKTEISKNVYEGIENACTNN